MGDNAVLCPTTSYKAASPTAHALWRGQGNPQGWDRDGAGTRTVLSCGRARRDSGVSHRRKRVVPVSIARSDTWSRGSARPAGSGAGGQDSKRAPALAHSERPRVVFTSRPRSLEEFAFPEQTRAPGAARVHPQPCQRPAREQPPRPPGRTNPRAAAGGDTRGWGRAGAALLAAIPSCTGRDIKAESD